MAKKTKEKAKAAPAKKAPKKAASRSKRAKADAVSTVTLPSKAEVVKQTLADYVAVAGADALKHGPLFDAAVKETEGFLALADEPAAKCMEVLGGTSEDAIDRFLKVARGVIYVLNEFGDAEHKAQAAKYKEKLDILVVRIGI